MAHDVMMRATEEAPAKKAVPRDFTQMAADVVQAATEKRAVKTTAPLTKPKQSK